MITLLLILQKSNEIARALAASALLLYCCLSQAQYTYAPGNPDEVDTPGIRYFGAAKDENGALLPGVTVTLSTQQADYVLITDQLGRYHVRLPVQAVASTVTAKCSKAGFTQARVSKRTGPTGPKPTVQLDCVLAPAKASSLPK